MPRGCVNRIRLGPPGRNNHSGILIGAGGTRRSDWSGRVLANDVNTRFDRKTAREEQNVKKRVVHGGYE